MNTNHGKKCQHFIIEANEKKIILVQKKIISLFSDRHPAFLWLAFSFDSYIRFVQYVHFPVNKVLHQHTIGCENRMKIKFSMLNGIGIGSSNCKYNHKRLERKTLPIKTIHRAYLKQKLDKRYTCITYLKQLRTKTIPCEKASTALVVIAKLLTFDNFLHFHLKLIKV